MAERWPASSLPAAQLNCPLEGGDILTLVSELLRTIEVVYTDDGGEPFHLVKQCRSRTTLKARIARSHVLLERYFFDLQSAQSQERARIERLLGDASHG